jgi:prepilin-type N-terminal cleavage/methylation domain-containing protein
MEFAMGIKKNMYRLSKENKGFTLLEVCIAMCVLGIGILGVTSLQVNAVRNVSVGNIYSKANTVANQHIEYLKTIPIEILDDDWNKTDDNIKSEEGGPAIFTRTTQISLPSEIDAVANPTCRLITVIVSWTGTSAESAGAQHSITVRSLTRGEGI